MRKPRNIIRNSWSNTKLFCARHQSSVEMPLDQFGKQILYHCPLCSKETGTPNAITLNDFEKMIDTLNDMVVSFEMNDCEMDMRHYCWKTREGIRYKVLNDFGGAYEVAVDNPKSSELIRLTQ